MAALGSARRRRARSVERHLPRGRLADRERTGFRAGSRATRLDGCLDGRDATAACAGQRRARRRASRRPATTATAPNGISTDAAFPNLAGQSAEAIYKQLEDYKSGKRDPAVMGVFVSPLSEQDILDLAAHFASLPDPFAGPAGKIDPADAAARNLIEVGDPLRGIAPCAACHGPLGVTPGAPGLRGQQRAYLEQQLQAFASGQSSQRHQRADAKHCAPVDQRRDRDDCGVLFERSQNE